MRFSDLAIPDAVMAGIQACGFTECTPIQALTLPLSLAGRDVAGQAQTGTGKTAAFLIAAFSRLVGSGIAPRPEHDPPSRPRALIIAPTRELVVQIENDARNLAAHLDLNIAAVYGGVDYEKQRLSLSDGRVDLLIGTPGRLIDYFKQKVYRVSEVEVLVIDEADRMFDMGFIDDLRFMLRRLPPYDRRLSMLFSATLSYRAQELSYEYMDSPEVISTTVDSRAVAQVTQRLYHVEGRRKISLLVGLLRRDLAEASEEQQAGRAMIFVNTKRMGEKLKEWLRGNGIHAGYLSGDVPQTKRLQTLRRFQDGLVPVLIATDVAGRGLHIEGVTHVINFDLPDNPEDYVHRIGRTARAGATGDAISLVDEDGAYNLEAIFAYLGMDIQAEWPENELFVHLTRPVPVAPEPGDVPLPPRRRSGSRSAPPPRRRSSSSYSSVPVVTAAPTPVPTPAPEVVPEAASPDGISVDGEASPARRKRRRRKKSPAAQTPVTTD
ncbi:MAG: DEAD/DEAH box helicase [Magnetococcales bacterium]|nr:DEAD/DEAH box helicase [Magnetococcales bacterium]